MIDIEKLILSLQGKRKVFHSEDDFKLSLGIEILQNHADCQVRLERPIDIKMIDCNGNNLVARAPIDIVILENNGSIIPIELKYKTKKTMLELDGETYRLTDHGAVDVGRYSFRKDIYRIEQYLDTHSNAEKGYVLILTNETAYFDKNVFIENNCDKNFSFHNGASILKEDNGWHYDKLIKAAQYEKREGDARWWYKHKNKLHWTCAKELSYKLDLQKDYEIKWKDYSSLPETYFKYCLIEVKKN